MTRDPNIPAGPLEDDEARVRKLIREAGPRPEIPAADLEALRTTAQTEWLRVVTTEGVLEDSANPAAEPTLRAASRHRAWALAAAVLIAIALGWWAASRSTVTAAVATIAVIDGAASVDGVKAVVGAPIAPGSTVEVGDGGLALRLPSGHSVRLRHDSRAILADGRRLDLARGAVYVDSGEHKTGASLTIGTALGSVREIGTRYEVRLDPAAGELAVRVRDGRVVLEGAQIECPDGSTGRCEASAGDELRLRGDTGVERLRAAAAWDWASGLAPLPDRSGLLDILHWGAREEGIEIAWSEPTLRQVAGGHTYSGIRQSPRAVIENALGAAGLAYRWEPGRLVVTGAAP